MEPIARLAPLNVVGSTDARRRLRVRPSPAYNSCPSNRSRKRSGFSAPLGPGPFRGPFYAPAAYNAVMSDPLSPPGAERLLRWIMVAIVAWGVFHAIGAWMLNHDARRPLVVLACVGAFLGFWLLMLSTRSGRVRRR